MCACIPHLQVKLLLEVTNLRDAHQERGAMQLLWLFVSKHKAAASFLHVAASKPHHCERHAHQLECAAAARRPWASMAANPARGRPRSRLCTHTPAIKERTTKGAWQILYQ